jgi:hypothetical protein
MKITLDLTDSLQLADALDAIVLAHLKSSRDGMAEWIAVHPDDVKMQKKIKKAYDVLIEYYGGYDAV